MPVETSANLGLDYLMPAQAQKHVTVNESFRRLDALVQTVVVSRTVDVQPADPPEGAIYLLPAGASGESWTGQAEHDLAYFRDGAWTFMSPKAGWRAVAADEMAVLVFDGGDWIDVSALVSSLANLARLGVGTQADAANPFSAKLNSALWTALTAGEGGSGNLRYVLNKEGAGNVLSLLFQSGWSGRAEVGLIGDDDLALKVSPDGSAWTEAARIDRAQGGITLAQGLTVSALNSGPLAGLRNMVINGGFDIWARADSQTASGYGSADRFRFVSDDAGFLVSRETLNPGDIPAPLHSFLRIAKPNSGSYAYFSQRIESVRSVEGVPVTLSFWARSADSVAINDIGLYQDFGSGGSAKVFNTFAYAIALTPAWQRISLTLTLPSIAGKTIGSGHHLELFFNLFAAGPDAGTIDIAGIQVECGPIATPFEARPIALETALCARYFQKKSVQSENGSRHVPLSPLRSTPTLSLSAGSASAVTSNGFELTHASAATVTVAADAEI